VPILCISVTSNNFTRVISIIICSRTQTINEDLCENIKRTIGCEYELIVIDNSENQYSIFEAYNLGIEKSTGEYLCLMHDDILLHTMNWGLIVNDIFEQNKELGLLGVAGAKSKTKMPSAWWDCPEVNQLLYLKQHLKNGSIEKWEKGFTNTNMEKVVAIDGVFMVARKEKQFRFQESFEGFHGYDLNISFEYIKLGYEIMVSKLILLEHFSLGTLDENWYSSTLQLHKLYSNLLPLKVNKSIVHEGFEFLNGVNFIKGLIFFRFKKEAVFLWLGLIVVKPISRFHFKFLKEILK
jgi:glycosyltransferase involved in cell wall biosynthesis